MANNTVKAGVDIDLSSFKAGLNQIITQVKETTAKIGTEFQQLVIDVSTSAATASVKGLADAFNSASQQSQQSITQIKSAMAAMIVAGKGGTDEFKALEAELKNAVGAATAYEQAMQQVTAAERAAHDAGKDVAAPAAESMKAAEKAGGGFASTLQSGLGTALGVLGGGAILGGIQGIVGGFSDIVESGKNAIEATQKLEIAFTSAGVPSDKLDKAVKDVSASSRRLADEFGLSTGEVREYAATAAGLSGATGKQNEDMVKLAIGIEKATNGMVAGGAAIKLLSKGVADPENAAALDKLKNKFPSLGAAIAGAGDSSDKMKKALETLTPTLNVLKEHADGPLGSMQRMTNSFNALKGSLGKGLIEAFAPIISGLADIVIPIANLVTGVVKTVLQLLDPITKAFKSAFDGIGGGGVDFAKQIQSAIQGIVDFLKPIIAFIADIVVGRLFVAFDVAKGAVTIFFNIISQLFGRLGDVFKPILDLFKSSGSESESFIDKVKKFEPILNDVIGVISEFGRILVEYIITTLQVLVNVVVGIVKFFKELFTSTKDVGAATKETGGAVTTAKSAFESMHETLKNIKGTLGGVAEAFRYIKDRAFELIDAIVHLRFDQLGDIIKKSMTGIGDAYDAGFNRATQAINETADATENAEQQNDKLKQSLLEQAKQLQAAYDSLSDTQKKLGVQKITKELTVEVKSKSISETEQKQVEEILKALKEKAGKEQDIDKAIADIRKKTRQDAAREELASLKDEREKALKSQQFAYDEEIKALDQKNTELQKKDGISAAQLTQLRVAIDEAKEQAESTNLARLKKIRDDFDRKEIESELRTASELMKLKAETEKLGTEDSVRERFTLLRDALANEKAIELSKITAVGEARLLEEKKINAKYNPLFIQNERDLQAALGDVRIAAIDDRGTREYEAKVAIAKQALQKELDDSKGNALKISEAYRKFDEANLTALSEFRQRKAASEAEAERIKFIDEAQKQYNEEYQLAEGNVERQRDIYERYLDARAAADKAYLLKSSALYRAAEEVQRNFIEEFTKTDDKAKKESVEKAKDEASKATQENLDALKDQSIGFQEYQKKQLDAARKEADAEKKVEDDKNEYIKRAREALAKSFDTILKKTIASQEEANARQISAIQNLQANEEEIVKKRAELKDAEAAGDAARAAQLKGNITSLQSQIEEGSQSFYDTVAPVFSQMAQVAGLAFGKMLAENNNFGKALALGTLKALQAGLPSLITMIVAKYVAANPILGFAIATPVIGILEALLAKAEQAAQKFAHGVVGFRGRGSSTSDDNQVMISDQESIITADGTSKNRAELEFVNKGGSLKDYFWTNYMPQISAQVQAIAKGMIKQVAPSFIGADGKLYLAPETVVQLQAPAALLRSYTSSTERAIAEQFTALTSEVRQVRHAVERTARESVTEAAVDVSINLKSEMLHAEIERNARLDLARK